MNFAWSDLYIHLDHAIKIQNISMTLKAPCVSSQSVHLYASSEGNPWPAHYHYRSDVFPRV